MMDGKMVRWCMDVAFYAIRLGLETVLKLLLPAKSPDFVTNRKLFFIA